MIPQCRLDSPRPRELNDADEWRSLMKKILSGIIAVVSLSGSTLRADDITRDSQEALRIGAGPRPIPCTALRAHLQRSTKETVWQPTFDAHRTELPGSQQVRGLYPAQHVAPTCSVQPKRLYDSATR